MNTELQIVKRRRGRPPKSELDRMYDGKFTAYLGPELLQELTNLSQRQHVPCSVLVRQAVSDFVYRFRIIG